MMMLTPITVVVASLTLWSLFHSAAATEPYKNKIAGNSKGHDGTVVLNEQLQKTANISIVQGCNFKSFVSSGQWQKQSSLNGVGIEKHWSWVPDEDEVATNNPSECRVWEKYSREKLCALIPPGKEILIVGDSISAQHFMSFYDRNNYPGVSWTWTWGDWEQTGIEFPLCPTVVVRYIRNDLLSVDEFGWSKAPRMYMWNWTEYLVDAAVLVLNTGAHSHYHGDVQAFESRLRKTVRYLRQHYKGRVIWRNILIPHPHCWEYDNVPLSPEKQNRTIDGVYRDIFQWQDFPDMNRIAERLFRENGFPDVLDPSYAYSWRIDHHNWVAAAALWENTKDCFHYMLGPVSPLLSWPDFLLNRLLKPAARHHKSPTPE